MFSDSRSVVMNQPRHDLAGQLIDCHAPMVDRHIRVHLAPDLPLDPIVVRPIRRQKMKLEPLPILGQPRPRLAGIPKHLQIDGDSDCAYGSVIRKFPEFQSASMGRKRRTTFALDWLVLL
jgi:hypothetical protein